MKKALRSEVMRNPSLQISSPIENQCGNHKIKKVIVRNKIKTKNQKKEISGTEEMEEICEMREPTFCWG